MTTATYDNISFNSKTILKSHSLQIYLTMIAPTYSFLCVPTDPVTTKPAAAAQQQRQKEEQPQPQFQNQQSTIPPKKIKKNYHQTHNL